MKGYYLGMAIADESSPYPQAVLENDLGLFNADPTRLAQSSRHSID